MAPLLYAGAAMAQQSAASLPPLAERIAHTDPSQYRRATSVHGGAGTMDFGSLLGATAVDTNFIFLHRGVINPKSGIGQHFHNDCEEMFVILDGEAQFTIDGRTSTLKGPVGAPNTAGSSHGIYNASDRPVQWLNINVGNHRAVYDNFDLGDPRVGVPLDPIPQFMAMRLDRALLRPVERMRGGTGTVQYRRALGPAVFRTPWSYVDHVLVPPGASLGRDQQADMSEVYYILGGEGTVTVDGETAPIRTGDAIPVRTNQAKSFAVTGSQPLEMMIIGVARDQAAKRAFIVANAPPRR